MKKFYSTCLCIYFSTLLLAQSDNPCSATELVVGDSCVYVTATTVGATYTSGVPSPGCGSFTTSSRDIWYYLTVPASGNIIIETIAGTITNGAMALYSGTCSSLTLIECDDNDMPGASNMPLLDVSGLSAGSTVYLRLWKFLTGTGTFNICAYAPETGPPPANDEASTATLLNVGDTCTLQNENNLFATASPEPSPGCGSFTGSDVWFKLVIPISGEANIETEAGTLSDGAIAVYTGSSGSLTLQGCDDDGGKGTRPSISAWGLPGDTVWGRFWKNGGGTGTFTICAYIQPFENNDCIKAVQFCDTETFDDNALDIGCVDDLNEDNHGCLTADENQPAWYIFQFTTGGSFQFNIDPLTDSDDYDFAVYGPYPDCYNMVEPIKCSFALGAGDGNTGINSTLNGGEYDDYEDYSGNQWVEDMEVLADEIYYVMIDNYSSSSDGFTISFGGTATISCDPITLLALGLETFNGFAQGSENILTWQMNAGVPVHSFEIQRMQKNGQFSTIGTVSGNMNASHLTQFQFADTHPQFGENYYRLKLAYSDGESDISQKIAVTNLQVADVSIYPNPAHETFTIAYYSPEEQNLEITLLNSFGQVQHAANVHLRAGQNHLQLQLPSKGIYQLVLTTKDEMITRQMMSN
ncbi:MAG: T9SS type A sorting domain-containing protein [Chitinophagales bacterium]